MSAPLLLSLAAAGFVGVVLGYLGIGGALMVRAYRRGEIAFLRSPRPRFDSLPSPRDLRIKKVLPCGDGAFWNVECTDGSWTLIARRAGIPPPVVGAIVAKRYRLEFFAAAGTIYVGGPHDAP